MASTSDSTQFAVFRAHDAVDFESAGLMSPPELTTVQMEGAIALDQAGYAAGHCIKLLFSGPGMSLAHVWFKSGFPLPRHSHDIDCLYYILAGTIQLGTKELGPGDGFFVGADVPYTYTPGSQGVELLEFRASSAFGIRLLANNPAYWAKAAEAVRLNRDTWKSEQPPSTLELRS